MINHINAVIVIRLSYRNVALWDTWKYTPVRNPINAVIVASLSLIWFPSSVASLMVIYISLLCKTLDTNMKLIWHIANLILLCLNFLIDILYSRCGFSNAAQNFLLEWASYFKFQIDVFILQCAFSDVWLNILSELVLWFVKIFLNWKIPIKM